MSTNILTKLRALPKPDQRDMLADFIKSEFKKALHIADGDPIAVNTSIFDLGLNSLGAETLKQHLEKILQCKVETADFFDNPTIGYFIENLSDRLLGDKDDVAERVNEEAKSHDVVNAMLNTMYGIPKG